MKVRTEFVTNSSSSSFVLAFKDKEDGITQITKELLDYNSEILGRVIKDFIEATPITPENVLDVDNSFSFVLECEAKRKDEYKQFEEEWGKNNPDKERWEIYKDPNHKKLLRELVKKEAEIYLERFSDKPYVVELEYEDHTDIGYELECNVLPYCKFVYKTFNHH